MKLRDETEKYLGSVERYAGKKLRYRIPIATLIDLAARGQQDAVFEKIIFLAKFITRGFDILRRSGIVADETKNLAEEIEKNLQQVTGLIRSLCAVDPRESAVIFDERYFSLSHESLSTIQELLAELTWIKNYSLDGHPVPMHPSPPIQPSRSN